MNLSITGISSDLGVSVENRFQKVILPVKDPGGGFNHNLIVDYAWSGNTDSHHVEFGILTGSVTGESLNYIVDSGNSLSGLASGNATFQFRVDYPSGDTFGTLNSIHDDRVNRLKAKAVVVTGEALGGEDTYHNTGEPVTSTDFIVRPFAGKAIAGEYIFINSYQNLEPEYLMVYMGGTPTNGFVHESGDIYALTPSFQFKNIAIEIENGVNRITGGYLEVITPPEILDVNPNTATWGDTITVSGTNFIDVTGVLLNGSNLSSFNNPNYEQVSFTVPDDLIGPFNIQICATGGCSE